MCFLGRLPLGARRVKRVFRPATLSELTNLVFNAVDALPQGGTITIRTHMNSRVSEDRGEEVPRWVLQEVRDTGGGMDKETRQHCLEPFFSTKGERGTGLGLAMVYGVMQRHEGDMVIESRLGQGTTMRLMFPVREPSEATDFSYPNATTALPPLRVLYIDDEPLLRELVQEALEGRG